MMKEGRNVTPDVKMQLIQSHKSVLPCCVQRPISIIVLLHYQPASSTWVMPSYLNKLIIQ
eukprot:scaffold248377_cov74-Cyclotella_meneghiniana.AAC.1